MANVKVVLGGLTPLEFGRKVKSRNALAATLSGGMLTLSAAWFSPSGLGRVLVGFTLGLLYANLFEYCLHRFALHAPAGFLSEKHGLHHSTFRSDEEPIFTNFAHSPWVVVFLIGANAAPVIAAEWLWRPGLASGVLVAFTIYFIGFEEMHWKIHMGGLPRWLEFSRRHHFAHHAGAPGRFNVWLPVCDRLVGMTVRARR